MVNRRYSSSAFRQIYENNEKPTSVEDVKLTNTRSSGLDGGRTFFNAVKEGDTVIFASDDEQDRILWVQAMYRATGQSHKPVPPTQVQKLNSRGGTAPQLDAPISQFCEFVSGRGQKRVRELALPEQLLVVFSCGCFALCCTTAVCLYVSVFFFFSFFFF